MEALREYFALIGQNDSGSKGISSWENLQLTAT
jgi:hypothetical protein